MKIRFFGILALLIAASMPAAAGDLLGRWTAEFDTPIGVQKYVYEFKKTGDAVGGEATFERSIGSGTVQLKNVKVDGDKISFAVVRSFNGNEFKMLYKGTVAEKEIKFTLSIANMDQTFELVAKKI